MQTAGRGHSATCIDDGTGRPAEGSGFADKTTWVAVDMTMRQGTTNTLDVNLTTTSGKAFGVRYAWQGDCCSEDPPTSKSCPIASCPLMGESSKLPANPFVAKIVGGKCECVAPQTCDSI